MLWLPVNKMKNKREGKTPLSGGILAPGAKFVSYDIKIKRFCTWEIGICLSKCYQYVWVKIVGSVYSFLHLRDWIFFNGRPRSKLNNRYLMFVVETVARYS